MKKRIIFIIFILILILLITTIVCVKIKNHKKGGKDGIYNITYVSKESDACLTFYNKSNYSLYDCDSEPTDYFFDTESECTYKYDGTYITFKCKYNIQNAKTNKIKVIKWDEKTFEFEYEGKSETFTSKN